MLISSLFVLKTFTTTQEVSLKNFLFGISCQIILTSATSLILTILLLSFLITISAISKDEYFFKGHFPNNPIVPGVIIVEAMAQTAGIVVSYKLRDYKEKSVLFMSVNKAKFRKPILPNDNVSFEVKFLNSVRDVYKFEGICLKENIKVCEAEFSAMITYK